MAAIIREDRIPYPNPIFIKHNLEVALENGMVVGVKGFAAGERELYEVGNVAEGDVVVLVNCDTVQYDDRLDERDFTLVKGKAGNANYLQKGELYTISKTFVEGADLAVGDKVKAKVGGTVLVKLGESETDPIAVVRGLVNYEGQASAKIEIL